MPMKILVNLSTTALTVQLLQYLYSNSLWKEEDLQKSYINVSDDPIHKIN